MRIETSTTPHQIDPNAGDARAAQETRTSVRKQACNATNRTQTSEKIKLKSESFFFLPFRPDSPILHSGALKLGGCGWRRCHFYFIFPEPFGPHLQVTLGGFFLSLYVLLLFHWSTATTTENKTKNLPVNIQSRIGKTTMRDRVSGFSGRRRLENRAERIGWQNYDLIFRVYASACNQPPCNDVGLWVVLGWAVAFRPFLLRFVSSRLQIGTIG